MKFFIPEAKNKEQEQNVYSAIKEFLTNELGAFFTDMKIYKLSHSHEGRKYHAIVGEEYKLTKGIVIAILYDKKFKTYYICTPHGGVLEGHPTLVNPNDVIDCELFEID